jgi:hypothetical protein
MFVWAKIPEFYQAPDMQTFKTLLQKWYHIKIATA